MFGINPTVLPTDYSLLSTLALDLSDHFSNASVSREYRIVIPAWGACVRLSSLAAGEAQGSRAQRVL